MMVWVVMIKVIVNSGIMKIDGDHYHHIGAGFSIILMIVTMIVVTTLVIVNVRVAASDGNHRSNLSS